MVKGFRQSISVTLHRILSRLMSRKSFISENQRGRGEAEVEKDRYKTHKGHQRRGRGEAEVSVLFPHHPVQSVPIRHGFCRCCSVSFPVFGSPRIPACQ